MKVIYVMHIISMSTDNDDCMWKNHDTRYGVNTLAVDDPTMQVT